MWHLWALELPWLEPEAALAAWGSTPWCAFLDSGGPVDARSRWQILALHPKHTVFVANGLLHKDGAVLAESSPQAVFSALRHALPAQQQGARHHPYDLPFYGGYIGFFDYYFGMQCEAVPSRHAKHDQPDCAFGFYEQVFVWDRVEKRAFLAGFSDNAEATLETQRQYRGLWNTIRCADVPAPVSVPRLVFTPDQTRAAYCAAVERAKQYIAAGDIFQVNITGRYAAESEGLLDDLSLYRALRHAAPAPFGAYLRCGEGYALLSTSPERFLQLNGQRYTCSRPIKGTAPRGKTDEDDRVFAQSLAVDEKECSENLMIVDLMRNDIGRVAEIGSVTVPEFLKVERFAHVHHLVSEVRGKLAEGQDVFDLLQATLPPGSVTGAPKHRAMQIIDELEASARGAYCGSIVCIGVEGQMESSVIIRTLVRHGNSLHIAAGGGITALSDPDKEYAEMCLKIAPLLAVFGQEP